MAQLKAAGRHNHHLVSGICYIPSEFCTRSPGVQKLPSFVHFNANYMLEYLLEAKKQDVELKALNLYPEHNGVTSL